MMDNYSDCYEVLIELTIGYPKTNATVIPWQPNSTDSSKLFSNILL